MAISLFTGFSGYFPKPTTTSDLFYALSVVADDGDVLRQADPLVTSHYLNELEHPESEAISTQSVISWPDGTRLLLVEDNQINQLVATGILNEYGLHADIAGNGLEALYSLQQALLDAPYSLALMDCQMPVMNGYEASSQIPAGEAGEYNKNILIITMMAIAMAGDREKCLQSGMNDYLSKPVDPDLLIKKIQQWLRSSAERQIE